MIKKTRLIILASTCLVLGLGGFGVGYMFLNGNVGETEAANVDDPTFQSTMHAKDSNKSFQNYLDEGDLNEILYVTNQTLSDQKYWKGTAEGGAVSVGQNQPVKNERIINYLDETHGKEVYFETLTYSMFNKTAERRYTNDTTYLLWKGKISSLTEASYDSSKIVEMKSKRTDPNELDNPQVYYYDRYGQTQDGLSNYILNDYTINNSYYVPEKSGDGKHTFHYDLNTVNEGDSSNPITRSSVEKYKREVMIMCGNEGYPKFSYSSIEITIDEDFRILSSLCKDGYDINKPLSTSVDSTLALTYEYSDKYIEIPDHQVFEKHFDTAESAGGGSDEKVVTALDLLAAAGSNLMLEESIYVDVNLFEGDNKLPIYASVKPDMANLSLDLVLGDLNSSNLFVNYNNNNAYVKFGNTEFRTTKDELTSFINEIMPNAMSEVSSQLGSLGDIDITQINGLDSLLNDGEVTLDKETKDAVITLHLKDLLGNEQYKGVNGTAYLGIKDYEENPKFTYIKSDGLDLGIEGLDPIPVDIQFRDSKQTIFPQVNKTAPVLENLSKYGKIIRNVIDSKKLEGTINLEQTFDKTFIKVNGKYKLLIDENNKFNISVNLQVQINEIVMNVDFLYFNNKFYFSAFDSVNISLTSEELDKLVQELDIDAIRDLFNLTDEAIEEIKNKILNSEAITNLKNKLSNLTIQGVLNMLDKVIEPIELTDNSISFKLLIDNYDIKLSLHDNGTFAITSDSLNMNIDSSVNENLLIEQIDDTNFVKYEEIHNLVDLLNKIIINRKVSIEINGQFNIPYLGISEVSGLVLVDFDSHLNLQVNLSLVASEFTTSLQITKNNDKFLIRLGDYSLVLSNEEIINLLKDIETNFQLDLHIDYDALTNLLNSTTENTTIMQFVNQVISFANSFSTSNSSNGNNSDNNSNILNNLVLVKDILSNISFTNNSINVSYNNTSLSLSYGEGLNISTILPSDNTFTYEEVSSYIKSVSNIINTLKFEGDINFAKTIKNISIKVSGNYKVDISDIANNKYLISANLLVTISNTELKIDVLIKDNKVYLTLLDSFKLAMTIDEFKEVITELDLNSIFELLGVNQSSLDVDSLLNSEEMKPIMDLVNKVKNMSVPQLINFVLDSTNLSKDENGLLFNLNVENYDLGITFSKDDGTISISSEILNLSIENRVNKDLVINEITDESSYYNKEDVSNVITLINNIINNKKVTLNINGQFNIPYFGLSSIDGELILDFNNHIDFELNANLVSNEFIGSIQLIKKDTKIFIKALDYSILIETSEVELLIKQIERLTNLSFNIDYEKLNNLLNATTDNTTIKQFVSEVISFVNSLSIESTNTSSSFDIDLVKEIISSLSIKSNELALSYKEINLSLSYQDFDVSNVPSNVTFTYSDLVSYIESVERIINIKKFDGSVSFSKVISGLNISVSGNYRVDISDIINNHYKVGADLSISIDDISVNVSLLLIDNKVYINLLDDSFLLAMTFDEFNKVVSEVNMEAILSFVGIEMPSNDTSNIVDTIKNNELVKPLFDLFESVKSMSVPQLINYVLDKVTLTNKEGNLLLACKVDNYDLSVNLNKDSSLSINSEILGLTVNNKVNSELVFEEISEEFENKYLHYSDIHNLVELINNIAINKKIYVEANGSLDIPMLGLSTFNGTVLIDLNNSVNLHVVGTLETPSFKLTGSLVKNGDRVFINLGTFSIELSLNDIPGLIKQIEDLSLLNFGIDYEALSTLLSTFNVPNTVMDLVHNITSFVNTMQISESNNGTSSTDIVSIVSTILKGLSIEKDALSLTYESIGSLSIRNAYDVTIPTIITNEYTLTYDDLSKLIEKFAILRDQVLKQETFHLALDLGQYSYLNGAQQTKFHVSGTVDLVLPEDKSFLSRNNIKFNATIALELENGKKYYFSVTYDGSVLFARYQNEKREDVLKGKISIDEGLKVLKYITQIMKIDNPIINMLISGVEGGLDTDIIGGYIKPDTGETKQIDINELLRSVLLEDNGVLKVSLSMAQLNNIDNVMDIEIGINNESRKLERIVINNALLSENNYLDVSADLTGEYVEVTTPSDSDSFMDLSTVELLIRSFFNSANTKNFEITGNFKLSLLNILNAQASIKIKIVLDDQFRPTVYVNLYFDRSGSVYWSNTYVAEGNLDIYYKYPTGSGDPTENKLYMVREFKYKDGLLRNKLWYQYRTLDLNDGSLYAATTEYTPTMPSATVSKIAEADKVKDLVIFFLQTTDAVAKPAIENNIDKPVIIKDPLENLQGLAPYYNDTGLNSSTGANDYQISANLWYIIELLGEFSVNIGAKDLTINNSTDSYITNLAVNGKALSNVATINLNGALQNVGQKVDLSWPTNLGYKDWYKN